MPTRSSDAAPSGVARGRRYNPGHRNRCRADASKGQPQGAERFSGERRTPSISNSTVRDAKSGRCFGYCAGHYDPPLRKYADRPEAEWPPLFFKILERRILDWHRRNTTRKKLFTWVGPGREVGDPGNGEVADFAGAIHAPSAEESVAAENTLENLTRVIEELPLRQQQVFLLRIWQGLDVRETAAAMRCSQGSVKTHLFRATARIRKALDEA